MRWRMNSEQVTWKMTWQLWRGDAFWTRQTQRIFSWQRMALALFSEIRDSSDSSDSTFVEAKESTSGNIAAIS